MTHSAHALNNILVVDDTPDCRELVSQILRDEGNVITAESVETAQSAIDRTSFDLLILDLYLPDGKAFQICTRILDQHGGQHGLRKRPGIFLITGDAGLEEKLQGFSLGVDDYIVKPFHPAELKARVRAYLRRQQVVRAVAEQISAGNLRLSPSMLRAWVETPEQEQDLDLTPMEHKLLIRLAKTPGRVLTRETLLESLWKDEPDITDRAIDSHVSRLRKKLDSCSHTVESVYGIGYRLIPKSEGGDP